MTGNIDLQDPSAVSGGKGHVHISVSDGEGVTVGGHLLSGNIVYTTAEITILEFTEGVFRRLPDEGPHGSGYNELKVFYDFAPWVSGSNTIE